MIVTNAVILFFSDATFNFYFPSLDRRNKGELLRLYSFMLTLSGNILMKLLKIKPLITIILSLLISGFAIGVLAATVLSSDDTDGDGIADNADPFPNDANNAKDANWGALCL